MTKPVLVAVTSDLDALELIDRELTQRYEAHYDVVCERSADAVVATLEQLSRQRRQVAVVLADQRVSGNRGPAVLSRVAELAPGAKRVLLIRWGDRSAAEAVRRGAALGQVDFWALMPWRSPDEDFLALVGEALREWSRATLPQLEIVRVVGEQWSARSHEVRDLLARNAVPFGFYDVRSQQGRRLLEPAGVSPERLPVLVLFDGRTLVDPTNVDLAGALGVASRPSRETFVVVVVGAGPAGLAASVYGTSEGLRSALLEREAIGGQAAPRP